MTTQNANQVPTVKFANDDNWPIRVNFSQRSHDGRWTTDSFIAPNRDAAAAWVNQMKTAFGDAFVASF